METQRIYFRYIDSETKHLKNIDTLPRGGSRKLYFPHSESTVVSRFSALLSLSAPFK